MNSFFVIYSIDQVIESQHEQFGATEKSKLIAVLQHQKRTKLVKRLLHNKPRNTGHVCADVITKPISTEVDPSSILAVIMPDDLLGLVLHNTLPQLEIRFVRNHVAATTDASYLLNRLTTIDGLKELKCRTPQSPSATEIDSRIDSIWKHRMTRIDYFIILCLHKQGYLKIANPQSSAAKFIAIASSLPRDLQLRMLDMINIINVDAAILNRFIDTVYRWF